MTIDIALLLILIYTGIGVLHADEPVQTPRPVPATRPELKELLEDMKKRPYRFPVPELTQAEQQQLGDRSKS